MPEPDNVKLLCPVLYFRARLALELLRLPPTAATQMSMDRHLCSQTSHSGSS